MDKSTEKRHSVKQFLLKNVTIITSMRGLAVFAAIFLDAVILAKLGMGSQTDAFFVANTIPFIIVSIVRLAAKVMQPLFIHLRDIKGENEGWRFLNLVITFSFLLLLLVGIVGALLSHILIPMQSPGFDKNTLSTGIKISMILFLAPVFLSITAIIQRTLQAFGQFFIPASLRFFEHLVKIIFVLILANKIGIYSLAYGIIGGSVLQFLIAYAVLRRKGYAYVPNFSFRDPELIKAARLISYPMLGTAAGQGIELFQNFLVSYLPPGSLSALRYASRIIGALAKILSGGVEMLLLPMISGNLARNNIFQMKKNLIRAVELLMFLTIPLSVWLAVMNKPLIRVMFERLHFTSTDTDLLSSIVLCMVPIIFLSRFLGLLETPFWANLDSRTPFFIMLIQACLFVTFSTILFVQIKVYAFPVAQCLSQLICSCLLIYLFSRKFGPFRLKQLSTRTFKLLSSMIAMLTCILIGRLALAQIDLIGSSFNIVLLILPTLMGGAGFLFTAFTLGLIKLQDVMLIIGRRFTGLKKKRSPF